MSFVYTPNASNNPSTYTCPSDGDPDAAATFNVPFNALMDKAAFIAAATANSVASYKQTFVAISNAVVTSALTVSGVTVATATFAASFNLLSTDIVMVHSVVSLSNGGTNSAFFKGGFAYSGGTSFVDSAFSQGGNSSTAGFIGQNLPYLYVGTGLSLTTVTSFGLQMSEGSTTNPVSVNQVRLIAAILRAG